MYGNETSVDSSKAVQPKITVTSYGRNSGKEETGRVTIEGFSLDEFEKMLGAMRGMYWVHSDNGRLVSSPRYEPPPNPIVDEEMLPFWRKPTKNEKAGSLKLFEMEDLGEHSSPSISIQSLCGYYYTPERYKAEAAKLESWGFECLRSRRGNDGQFWEVWFLSGIWSAKGALLESIKGIKGEKKKLEAATDFLGRNAVFRTLDVSVQRMAMVAD